MAISLSDLEITPFDPDAHDVSAFDCGDDDLNDFLKTDARMYQGDHLSHTRIVFLEGRIVAYITLLADCIILKTPEKKKALKDAREYYQDIYTFPAVKIGRLGVQKEFQRSGIGKHLLIYTIGLVVRLNDDLKIACRFITLDAYPQSVSWYEKYHFTFNKHYRGPKLQNEANAGFAAVRAFLRSYVARPPKAMHPSMRYDLLRSEEII